MALTPSVAIGTALVSLLIPVLIVIWVRKWKLVRSVEDYLVAGHKADPALIAASVASLYIWGSSVMGSAEGAYNWGLSGIWIYPMYSVGLWVFGIWARKFKEVFPYALAYTEYFKHRFDSKVHVLILIFAVATSFTGAWIQGLAAGHVLKGLTGGAVPYFVGVLILGVAVAIYIVIAGQWGSLITTWIFTLIAMPITALVGLFAWYAIGLPGEIINHASNLVQQGALSSETLSIFRSDAIIQYLPAVLAWALFSLPMQQDYWQQAFAAEKGVGRAFFHAGTWWFFMPFLSSTLGFAALVLYKVGQMPQVSGSEAYAALVGQFLPAWTGILFIWLIFAATVGTVGAAVLAIGNMIGNDFYRTYINRKATSTQIQRSVRIIILIATIAVIAISLTPLSILMVLLFMPMFLAPFVWAFIASQYKEWYSATPTFIGGIIGFAVGAYLFLGKGIWGPAMIVAFLLGGIISTIGSKIWPARFDFSILKRYDIETFEDEKGR